MSLDKDDKNTEETQADDVDQSEALAEISSELFGQGKDEEKTDDEDEPLEGEEGKPSDKDAADVADLPPQQDKEPVEGEENSEAVQATGAPQTWTKEALADWATIPERAKQEILKREDDFLKGITQYKEAADLGIAYSKVVEPYVPILAAENIDPVGLFQSFAGNHYILSRGTPAQKVEVAASLLNGYNIPLQPLLEFLADGGEEVDPKVSALQKRIDDLEKGIGARTQHENTQVLQRIGTEIDTFAADPAHPYFNEVADDIRKLFESGMASTLPEAYEKAVYANPTTRAKEIDRLTAERTSKLTEEEKARKEKRSKSQADQVKSTSKAKDGTVPKGSIDDTLQETYDAIQSRG